MDVRDAEVWQLVDERLNEVRALGRAELDRRAATAAEDDVVARPSGDFRRVTRVIALPHERFGLAVAVHADGGRLRAEGSAIVTADGAIAPEWSSAGDPMPRNPFAFGPRATAAGIVLAVVLMALFFLMT